MNALLAQQNKTILSTQFNNTNVLSTQPNNNQTADNVNNDRNQLTNK